MVNILTEKDAFLFPEFKFPNNLMCSYIFNRIFQDGDSFKDIENYLLHHAVSTQKHSDPNSTSLIQYNLKSDIWGPKEVVLLGILPMQGIDFSIVFGCRDNSQFDQILFFLNGHKNISVYSEEKNNFIFLYQNVKTSMLNMLVMIHVVKERTQSIKIGISFKSGYIQTSS